MSEIHRYESEHDNSYGSDSILTSAASSSRDCVKDHPISSTLVALGAGTAIGLLIANAISRESESRRDNYIKRLGHQISSSLSKVIPDSLSRGS